MVQLQAATASKAIVRKRKRKSQLEDDDNGGTAETTTTETETTTAATEATTSVPTKTHDGGKKPRRTPSKKSGDKPSLSRHPSSTLVETTLPWPEAFTKLAQIHKALNLIYTFCCTRKHLATTFDTIKGAVETNIKRPLSIEDVAKVKTLVPGAINFQYVDEAMLQVALMGEEDLRQGRKIDLMFPENPTEERNRRQAEGKSQDIEVLLFEFVDGDLKRQVRDPKTGEPTRAFRKLKEEELKMPVFSQKAMMKLIEKRNAKFTSAINAWLNESAELSLDPTARLETESIPFIPFPSTSRHSTPAAEDTLPKSIPTDRQSIPAIIAEIKAAEWYTGQIVPDGHRVFDPQEALYGDLAFPLSQALVNALYSTRQITAFYTHQASAINALHAGHNVIVSTSTSSGKSLIYQLPALHALEADREARALYIFPTKALAQDQRRSLQDLLHCMPALAGVLCETFDGDTPMAERDRVRDEARIIFTNPDMLHLTILPQEERWRHFLRNLRFVVMDELHVYNGLFGAHVAFVMRRLRRICKAVGNSRVQFISCSATVANPREHMRTLFGLGSATSPSSAPDSEDTAATNDQVTLIDFDGSPSGRKEFLCWNTPFKDPGDPSSGRGDTLAETARLFAQLVLRGVRVIAFCRVRQQCEILTTAVKSELLALDRGEVMARVMAYRGGYTAQDRRRIEREMFEGRLVGIIATSALELGVDIGGLDAVITVGFPYTIANLRQQSGRAGRRNRDSLSVLVGACFPTDQYYMSNPDEIFTQPNCALQVDLANLLVLEAHVQCAAHELPIRADDDRVYFGKQLPEICAARLRKDDLGFYHTAARFLPQPSRAVAIRDTEEDHFAVIDTTAGRNVVLEELEASRAFFTIYEGAIFLHQGRTYLVREMDTARMLAKVAAVRVDWTTQQRDYTDVDPIETEAIRRLGGGSRSSAYFGTIKVVKVVYGYFKVDRLRRILDAVQVDNPPIVVLAKGMWLDVPNFAIDILNSRRLNLAAGIHAAEHAVLGLMPNFVVSMPGDVRTECKVAIKEFAKKETSRKRPARLTFYDARGGAQGSGIAGKAFEFVEILLAQACERVEACRCEGGCLECCCCERGGEGEGVMSKVGAGVILKALLGREIDVEGLPWGDEEECPAGIETVVVAGGGWVSGGGWGFWAGGGGGGGVGVEGAAGD
ncbi:hypothetical protein LTR08_004927 [Meristemomyces frigidus]|nr:hypothetical protein LTR08_004927 [Meristemomyces frigidus]